MRFKRKTPKITPVESASQPLISADLPGINNWWISSTAPYDKQIIIVKRAAYLKNSLDFRWNISVRFSKTDKTKKALKCSILSLIPKLGNWFPGRVVAVNKIIQYNASGT